MRTLTTGILFYLLFLIGSLSATSRIVLIEEFSASN